MKPRVWLSALGRWAVESSNRLKLPAPTVLPIAGAVVGLYSGLAAGLFANLIGLVSGLCFGLPRVLRAFDPDSATHAAVQRAFAHTAWHPEYALVGGPLALGALLASRLIRPGEGRELVAQRLRVLSLLTLGALALYYPLVAMAALNTVFGQLHALVRALSQMPWWAMLIAPAAGGALAGWIIRDRPEVHGHGLPEVILAVKRDGVLRARGGLVKLVAASVTIGSGGSAGREGPIVFGGAAVGSALGRTLGFSRRELSVLLACGAGAGIAASFNAPIAGAIFALEIILREFELKVFSPIVLASVTGTLVGRGTMGSASMIERFGYQMVSGWEILGYASLGVLTGLVAYAFVRLLHHSERFFAGRRRNRVSQLLGRWPIWARAATGGLVVGALALVNPTVWGTGHDFVNLAAAGQLSLGFLAVAAALKLLATTVTIGSGGSGGTFFPATVIGAMAGGAFGQLLNWAFPALTAPSGAYAMVGMGGVVAGVTRGPLTGMMMLYELSGNYAIILPLMVTCTIASALCHALLERGGPRELSEKDLLRQTSVGAVAVRVTAVDASTRVRELADLLVGTDGGALPVARADGRIAGIVQLSELRDVWRDDSLTRIVNALDVARLLPSVGLDLDLASALETMDREDVDALPVTGRSQDGQVWMVSRASIRRFVLQRREQPIAESSPPFVPAEVATTR